MDVDIKILSFEIEILFNEMLTEQLLVIMLFHVFSTDSLINVWLRLYQELKDFRLVKQLR